jgi:hypothetical protein
MEENRFLRCVMEHRAEQKQAREMPQNRFTQFVAQERQSYVTTIPLIERRVWDSTPLIASPTESPPRKSFEERFAQARLTIPTSPLIIPRNRQNSMLSLASQESFPSLPSSTPTTPVMTAIPTTPITPTTPTTPVLNGWSEVLRKNIDILAMKQTLPRRQQAQVQVQVQDWEHEEEGEETIEYDRDGFPFLRYRR